MTAKLLYGSAFRAPSFNDQFGINNPTLRGNPNIQPETIKTLEAALDWLLDKSLHLNLNLFDFQMNDIIRGVPNSEPNTGSTVRNVGRQDGRGLEAQLQWQADRSLHLSGSYSYQRNSDHATGLDAGYAPRHHFYGRADWQIVEALQMNALLNWVAGRQCTPGDSRPPVADYRTLDLSLTRQLGAWSLSDALLNIFNADAREPTPAPGLIPNDLPLPGRSFLLQVVYRL
ncbi:TonB-dependent receptor plug domain-containing protein [Roseateles oligotrophus]|uniref:TonB-dependent receptor plug domain-containing protein n=1 Tax=Roseateles oligotrophus TaxID=1769250 RepID=UPI0021E3F794|nr:TonB-dependent receptor [Roseateles oligotrophus]